MKICLFIIAATLHVASSQTCSLTSPCTPLKGGGAFEEPLDIASSSGRLRTSLVVDMGKIKIDWLEAQRRLYNGTFPGPTLRFRAGDRLDVDLINNLQEPDKVLRTVNGFAFPNTTNIHTHGLHISSKIPQDNVFINVKPRESFSYRYEIDPDQPAGTYFYHSHQHNAGYFQVFSGMAGMLIVEDDPDKIASELEAISCPNNCENDLQFVLQSLQYASIDDGDFAALQKEIGDYEGFRFNNITVSNSIETLEEWLQDPANNIQYFLVNGKLRPTLNLLSGEVKRFRLLNAGAVHSLALRITGNGCSVKEIAIDGIYLPEPRSQRLGRSFLMSGGRTDWVVKCSSVGTFQLESHFTNADHRSLGDHPMFSGVLMDINVLESQADDPVPSVLPPLPYFLPDLLSVDDCDVGGRFVVEVTSTDTLNREDFTLDNIRYRMEVDTIQEWHFTNTEFETSHPIHMHVNTFQVVRYNPYTGPYGLDDGDAGWALFDQNGTACNWQHKTFDASLLEQIAQPEEPLKYLGHEEAQKEGTSIGYAGIGERRDTLLVPPLANITVRFVPNKYTGDVMVHCHLVPDADQGMMMTTQVVEKGSSMDANITSAGAYPGSCFNNEPIPQPRCGAAALTSGIVVLFSSLLLLVLLE